MSIEFHRLNNIKKLLKFHSEDTFYFIQIFQRRKDDPDLKSPVKKLKSYCIYSEEELDKLFPSIIKFCKEVNARAYIRLNSQNSQDVSLRCIEQMADNLRKRISKNNRNIWDSVSGQGGSKDYWIIDIDEEHINMKNNIEYLIKEKIDNFFLERKKTSDYCNVGNPTKTGIHVISSPFDPRILEDINKEFSLEGISSIQIQKDANTILYLP